jgi:hypothetical protein
MRPPKVLDNKKYRVVDELKAEFVKVQSYQLYQLISLSMLMQNLKKNLIK